MPHERGHRGRSANRGACAQACRLPYELLVDGELRDVGERAYLLSPEDLEASALVPELAKLGVTSLKIEGRLKGPEYVAATTRLYRSAVEKSGSLGELRSAALQMYTRGSGPGFLAGVNHQRLVEGRACDHRGLLAGEHLGVAKVGGRLSLRVKLAAEVARGDGLLVEGGLAGEGEIGGRVWGISLAGRDVERAPAGKEVAIWLGPDKRVDARGPARVEDGRSRARKSRARGGDGAAEQGARRRACHGGARGAGAVRGAERGGGLCRCRV
ncbi:MAG: U32 family peptidase [Polyangiaceae bacterium]